MDFFIENHVGKPSDFTPLKKFKNKRKKTLKNIEKTIDKYNTYTYNIYHKNCLILLNFLLKISKPKVIKMVLGDKIKALRLGCELTQEELADRCELTKGYISQLENDLTSPSIATLIDILSALGTNLKEFFAEDDNEEKIVFNKNEFIEKQTPDYVLNWVVPNAQKNTMEPLHMVLRAEGSTDEDFPHEGEEFGFVLKGEIVLCIGKRKLKVKKGESFYFKPDKVHKIVNNSNKDAEFIWVSSPPSF